MRLQATLVTASEWRDEHAKDDQRGKATGMRARKRRNRTTGLNETVLQPPICAHYAGFNNPFETISFLRIVQHLKTGIMLESKAKDLSLLRLRNDIARYAPELAPHYGIALNKLVEDASEIVEETEDSEAE